MIARVLPEPRDLHFDVPYECNDRVSKTLNLVAEAVGGVLKIKKMPMKAMLTLTNFARFNSTKIPLVISVISAKWLLKKNEMCTMSVAASEMSWGQRNGKSKRYI